MPSTLVCSNTVRLRTPLSNSCKKQRGVLISLGTTTNTIIHTIGRRLFSRTGRQLYCRDKDENGRCLLEVMADPRALRTAVHQFVSGAETCAEGVFVHTLRAFKRVLIVANGYVGSLYSSAKMTADDLRCHDLTVPYPTASISLSDPFQDYAAGTAPLHIEIDERNIVTSYSRSAPVPAADAETIGEDESIQQDLGDDDVQVTVTISPVRQATGPSAKSALIKARPRIPPILLLKWPFTYVRLYHRESLCQPDLFFCTEQVQALLAVLPLIIPLWLVFM